MKFTHAFAAATLAVGLGFSVQAATAADVCQGFGPQTPRDITNKAGTNPRAFDAAPSADKLNLCNLHLHVNAEHKGPGFSVFAGATENGGYKCNETASLTKAELADPNAAHGAAAEGHGAPAADAHAAPAADAHGAPMAAEAGHGGGCHGVKPGDTIEVHWVYSSCDVQPGEGLGSCLSDTCANPQLRVESQVFLVVNDPHALDFTKFDYAGPKKGARHQAKALPSGTGTPVSFMGSTTGPKYTEQTCSPLQVTWNVRPNCAKVDIGSLNKWCSANAFKENHGHGVRQLVTTPELLAPIH